MTKHQYNGLKRGAKNTLYEGGTRAAALVRGNMVQTEQNTKSSDVYIVLY